MRVQDCTYFSKMPFPWRKNPILNLGQALPDISRPFFGTILRLVKDYLGCNI